ncbi:hypothetical protein PG993_009571 [Apiospora rasikravindrae]|uniref:F-box domain-containing protein n=1 Tax=Apiospora rasikravindrae TaxID=990691 RepID=A0ABR1SJS2_9PEZI
MNQASQEKKDILQLESLPTELLTQILSTTDSAADLYALIRASPVAYRAFVSAKRVVLLNTVSQALGPVLRDAIAAALFTPTEVRTTQEYTAQAVNSIQKYEALPRMGRGLRAWALELPIESVFALVRANRDVQFFINEFEVLRLPPLRGIDPDAAVPLTLSERRRLAGSLFRHQFWNRIVSKGCKAYNDTDPVYRLFLGTSKPWERHQLADAHSLVCHIQERAFDFSPTCATQHCGICDGEGNRNMAITDSTVNAGGRHLRREVLPPGQTEFSNDQVRWMHTKLHRWRWLGFPFFDRARVERLKTRLPVYATGWLTVPPPPSEECRAECPEDLRPIGPRRVTQPVRRGGHVAGVPSLRPSGTIQPQPEHDQRQETVFYYAPASDSETES